MDNPNYKLYRIRLSNQHKQKALQLYPSMALCDIYSLLVDQFLPKLNDNTYILTETQSNKRVSVWLKVSTSDRVVTKAALLKLIPSRVVYTGIVSGLDNQT